MKTQAIAKFSDDKKTIIVTDCILAKDAEIEAEDFLDSMADEQGRYELIDPQLVRKPNEAGEYVFPVKYFPNDED